MRRQILEFLRTCAAPESILNGEKEQDEMNFSIDGEDITLLRFSDDFIFEIQLVSLPVSLAEKTNFIARVLECAAASTYLSDAVLCADDKGTALFLQKAIPPSLKNGLQVMQALISLLKTYDWWYNQLRLRGKSSGGDETVPGNQGNTFLFG